MEGFTDIHHHIVYGIDDDGPQTFEESVQMLWLAQRNGVKQIVATPHMKPGLQVFDEANYFKRLGQLCQYAQKLNITIKPGAEVMYTEHTCLFLRQNRIPTLGNTNYVLVEFLPKVTFEKLLNSLKSIYDIGYTPVLAHLERYDCLRARSHRVYSLKHETNTLLQMNCETVLQKGFLSGWWKRELLNNNLIDAVASDAHDTEIRSIRMREAYCWLETHISTQCAQRLTGCIKYNGFWNEVVEGQGG